MEKFGIRRIYFTGIRRNFDRLVMKHQGKFYVHWYDQYIQVYQIDNNEHAYKNWKTVEKY